MMEDDLILDISIHALLAESDSFPQASQPAGAYFYPRSPCGERPTRTPDLTTIGQFLSTLSLRRATTVVKENTAAITISIHALLAESDATRCTRRGACSTISIHALLAESDITPL